MESQISSNSWADFCRAVCGRFEREQHNTLIRQFFHVRQTSSVVEYVESFDCLVHQLLTHDPTIYDTCNDH